jgi:uncharacterized membrane protein
VNVLSINLAALIALWYSGYRPEHWFREDDARRATIKRVGILIVSIAVLSAFLGGVTLDSFQRATTEERIQEEAAATIEEFEAEHDLRLLDVSVDYPGATPFQNPELIVVTVGVPPGETVSGLAARIHQNVSDRIGTPVETRVEYVQIERS